MAHPAEDAHAAARIGSAKPLLQGNGVGHRRRHRRTAGRRLHATRSRQAARMQQCCTAVACNGAALRQGVVTGSLLTVTTPVARPSDLSTP